MSNKGQKALAGQVSALRAEIAKHKAMNIRLNNQIIKLQTSQFEMFEPSYFKSKRAWRKKWRKYRK